MRCLATTLSIVIASYACTPPSSYETERTAARAPLRMGAAHGIVGAFDGAHATVSVDDVAWSIGLVAWGRAGALAPVRPAAPIDDQGRATYERGGIREWYASTPRGIEQSFRIEHAPPGVGRLLLELGAVATIEGDRVALRDRRGLTRASLTELRATDARGAVLPTHWEMAGPHVAIAIDDASSVYPIDVDPLFSRGFALATTIAKNGSPFSTAIANDGLTIVVGADTEDSSAGAVRVWSPDAAGVWSSVRLTASDATANAQFGSAVAIDRDTLVIGAGGSGGAGVAYVFTRSPGGTWSQQAKLTPSIASSFLGRSVALSGDTALVGGVNSGAFVFVRTGTTWAEQTKLAPSDPQVNDYFGSAIVLARNAPQRAAAAPCARRRRAMAQAGASRTSSRAPPTSAPRRERASRAARRATAVRPASRVSRARA